MSLPTLNTLIKVESLCRARQCAFKSDRTPPNVNFDLHLLNQLQLLEHRNMNKTLAMVKNHFHAYFEYFCQIVKHAVYAALAPRMHKSNHIGF